MQLELATGFWLYLLGRYRMRTAIRWRDVQWHDGDGRIHCADVRKMRVAYDRIDLRNGRGLPVAHPGMQYARIAHGGVFPRRRLHGRHGLHDDRTNLSTSFVRSVLQQGV